MRVCGVRACTRAVSYTPTSHRLLPYRFPGWRCDAWHRWTYRFVRQYRRNDSVSVTFVGLSRPPFICPPLAQPSPVHLTQQRLTHAASVPLTGTRLNYLVENTDKRPGLSRTPLRHSHSCHWRGVYISCRRFVTRCVPSHFRWRDSRRACYPIFCAGLIFRTSLRTCPATFNATYVTPADSGNANAFA